MMVRDNELRNEGINVPVVTVATIFYLILFSVTGQCLIFCTFVFDLSENKR
jgi:hypothetical protein